MERFLDFGIPGIPYGCAYALFAVGLVLTYQTTGVFNFAFGAQAFASAFVFIVLVQNAGLPIWLSFVIAVVIGAPLLGLIFDRFLFRRIPNTNTTAKVVTGIALLVAIPTLLPVIFGNQTLYNPPTLFFNQSIVYFTLAGYPVNGHDLSVVVVTAVVLSALLVVMRFTSLGVRMRAAVESRRLVELDGGNAGRVVSIAWAMSSLLAGLAGVLLAPAYPELQAQNFITLMVAAIAAAACASLRSLPRAVVFGILLGVVSLLLQGYIPTQTIFYSSALPSIPFIVLVLALLFVPGLRDLGVNKDPMSSVDTPMPPLAAAIRSPQMNRIMRTLWLTILAFFVISMLTWIPANWENVFNSGLAFSTLFLSITMITGMGGQLSLAQGTLAGVGAFVAVQLGNHLGVNMVVGMLIGAGAAATIAIVLALLSLRLKGLGLALMTLAAALFFDSSVFPVHGFTGGQSGVNLQQSWSAPFNFYETSGHQFFILAMVVLTLVVFMVVLVRRGTVGRYLGAIRGSETASAGLGINLTWQRLLVFALSGGVAGVGGTLLVINTQNANPNQFNYQLSLVFVVIVITTGVTTVEGAIQGGIGFVVIQQLLTYVPSRFQGLTVVLFAAGALTYARHPEGIVEFAKRKSTLLLQHHLSGGARLEDQPGGTPGSGGSAQAEGPSGSVARPPLSQSTLGAERG
ncbi:MAG TPA: ABC transporter permease [Acidimicrobiales bacterium]|nr:ABC transporter permease [Acidimicrobiales bacterium]